jgi:hypothetical protein
MSRFDLPIVTLLYTLQPEGEIAFGPQAGAQLRGGLWEALRSFACTDPLAATLLVKGAHSYHCPMCRLMALEEPEGARGQNPVRPFALSLYPPPPPDKSLSFTRPFQVRVTLFGEGGESAPYIHQGMYQMGRRGVGYRRGRFTVMAIEAVHPFTGERQALLDSKGQVSPPSLVLRASDVEMYVATLPPDALTLDFLTPTMLTEGGKTLSTPTPTALIGRLLERCQHFESTYCSASSSLDWREVHTTLKAQAQNLSCETSMRWVRVESGSNRIMQSVSMSGFVGRAVLRGELAPFIPWLVWGSLLGVGKNVVKGCGQYRLVTGGEHGAS